MRKHRKGTLLKIVSAILQIAIIASCNNIDKNDQIFEKFSNTLNNSSNYLNGQTNSEFDRLQNKLTHLPEKEKAVVWFPKAKRVRNYTGKIILDIEKLEKELFQDNRYSTGSKFYILVLNYQDSLLNIDPEITERFKSKISSLTTPVGFDSCGKDCFLNLFFNTSSQKKCSAVLANFKNQIRFLECEIITFCNLKCSYINDVWNKFSFIAVQNLKHLKKGDDLEITAGVGEFVIWNKPKITINGIDIKAGDDYVFSYKTKISGTKGKYSIPVKVEYTNTNGEIDTITHSIEYFIDE